MSDQEWCAHGPALNCKDCRIEELQAEVGRLKKALAESCDENRELVLAEGPWSTDMCPTASKLSAENERLQDDLEHLGRVIANINDHHTRLQEKHRDAVLFLRSTLFNDGEAGSRLMEILSPTAAVQETDDE